VSMKASTLQISYLALLLVPPATLAQAQGFQFDGELSVTGRYFEEDGALAGQPDAGVSWITDARLSARTDLSFGRAEVELYNRTDSRTGTDRFDVTKAFVETNGPVRFLLGNDVVFWGVADSYNPTNIINQQDQFSGIGKESQIGQPMARVSFDTEQFGTFSFFGLIGFQEPAYWEEKTRLRFDTVPDGSRALFEGGERDFDFAFRNTNTVHLANGSLDYAISLFSGTSREPVYLPGCAFPAATVSEAACTAINTEVQATYEGLPSGGSGTAAEQVFNAVQPSTQAFLSGGNSTGSVPYYQELHQVGLGLAYASGDWLLKFEGAQRSTDHGDYFSGVIGAEYNFGDVFGQTGELRAGMEYIHDTRSNLHPTTIFDNDIYGSLRYDFNNAQGTSIALQGLLDTQTDGLVLGLEVASRLTDSTRVEFSSTFIDSDDPSDPLTALDNDDFHQLTFTLFF